MFRFPAKTHICKYLNENMQSRRFNAIECLEPLMTNDTYVLRFNLVEIGKGAQRSNSEFCMLFVVCCIHNVHSCHVFRMK